MLLKALTCSRILAHQSIASVEVPLSAWRWPGEHGVSQLLSEKTTHQFSAVNTFKPHSKHIKWHQMNHWSCETEFRWWRTLMYIELTHELAHSIIQIYQSSRALQGSTGVAHCLCKPLYSLFCSLLDWQSDSLVTHLETHTHTSIQLFNSIDCAH